MNFEAYIYDVRKRIGAREICVCCWLSNGEFGARKMVVDYRIMNITYEKKR